MPQKAYKQIVGVSFKLKKPPQMHSYYSQFLLICSFMITQFCGSNIFFKCVINIENMPKWCLPQDFKAIVYVILLAFRFFLLQALLYVSSKSSKASRATRLWSSLQRANMLSCTPVACEQLLPRHCIVPQWRKPSNLTAFQEHRAEALPLWANKAFASR